MKILYEDNHIIVVVKPVNVPVQADETGDPDLLSAVKAYIKEKYNKPGEVYCGLVHRLDRPVGGVMVFARTSKAASRLMPQFAEKNRSGAKKRYMAVTCGTAPEKGELHDQILRIEADHSSIVVPEGTEGAKAASLCFETASMKKGLSLLDIELHTGRHHQIRVQLSHAGYPIWGDQRYNENAVVGQQIALFAYSLSIEHPVLRERMTFTALPEGGIWREFYDEVRLVAAGLRFGYADRDVLVIKKPAGVTVSNADGGDATLESMLSQAMGEVYPVHRLDAMTSGLVIFARNERAKEALDTAIRERTIEKVYHLIVKGRPKAGSGRLSLYAVKSPGEALVRVYDEDRKGAVLMVTDYRVIKSVPGASLVEASLVTGRTHQIRASFSHIGCPILGDDKYGDREFNRDPAFRACRKRGALCLAAVRLRFEFPKGSCLERLNGICVSCEAPFELKQQI